MKLDLQVGLGPDQIVLDGDPAPPPQRGTAPAPNFLAHVYCSQTAGWTKLVLGMEIGLSPADFVLDGDPVPFPQKGAEPPSQFSAHFYCGKRAACIKMPLGIELNLGPGEFVFPLAAPSPKGAQTPQFSAHILTFDLLTLVSGHTWRVTWSTPPQSLKILRLSVLEL